MRNQVQVANLQDWLRKFLSNDVSQAERERDKLLAEIARALDSIAQFCGQLSGKAEQDMESKRDHRAQYRAAKAVARLTSIIPEMCKDFGVPTANDSTSLRNLQRETSKLASDAARTREGWLRQIRPYYIIDMMTLGGNIDKLRRLGDELHNFLIGRGSILRSLEELNEKLDSLSKIKALKDSASSQRRSVERRIGETEQVDRSLRDQVEAIRENPKIKEYVQVDAELRALRSELIHTGFSRLGRPLKKLISISERGDYPLPVDVREGAKEYIKKPFATFLAEESSYPRLKSVMLALSRGVSSGKLALKQREAKKVIERTEQVVSENSLAKIHEKSKERKRTYDKFLADQETADLVRRLRDLRQKGRANRNAQGELRAELRRAIENERRYDEQANSLLKDIEAFSRKLSGADVELQLS
jgi:hypothetical protein